MAAFDFDLFLSFHSADGSFSKSLYDELELLGVRVWFAPDVIREGDAWLAELRKAIPLCRHFVYLGGENISPWQLFELEQFRPLRTADPDARRIVPYRIGKRTVDEAKDLQTTPANGVSAKDLARKAAAALGLGRPLRPSASPPAPSGALGPHEINKYKATLASLHGTIEIAGFETRLRTPIRLDELCVTLYSTLDLGSPARDDEKPSHGGFRGTDIPLLDGFRHAARLERRGVVLLGHPGSGKTTHLRRVALYLATRDAPNLGLPRDCLPVFLPLRNLGDTTRDLAEFIEAECRTSFSSLPKGFARQLIERGNLVYLLDGLDEVPAERRPEIAAWIKDGIERTPNAHFLVSSRFAGYTEDVHLGARFLELQIRPMDDPEAETFVTNWYAAVETGLDTDQENASRKAREHTRELIAVLRSPKFQSRSLKEMTANPLLLTAICLVHRDRAKLPDRRVELYDECVNVLIERWRAAKKLAITIDAKTARQILQPMALWLHQKEGRTRATAAELAPILAPALVAAKCKVTDPAAFLATIRDESGLLTGFGHDSFGFMHLGFQEYLAAREILSRHRAEQDGAAKAKKAGSPATSQALRELVAHFGESWWREVTQLLLALEDPPFVPFFRELVRSPAFATAREDLSACLDDAVTFLPDPFVELLSLPPGKDRQLWSRQAVALWILNTRAKAAREPVAKLLAKHPSPEIRASFAIPAEAKGGAAASKDWRTVGGLEFAPIPAGSFLMGSPENEEGHDSDEGPQHNVTLDAFWLARTPVTNGQYEPFLAATKRTAPEYWKDRNYNQTSQPVVGVTWDDTVAFCRWLGNGARLPTEAEWEYACRAGTTTRFWSGDKDSDLAEVGWFAGNSEGRLHPVAEKRANQFGLFDMHGNVGEWCADWMGPYRHAAAKNPTGPASGSDRVFRGGSFGSDAGWCRSAFRGGSVPGFRWFSLGFRVALPPPSR